MRIRSACLFGMATISAALATDAPKSPAELPPCELTARATLDMEMDNTGRITVPVSINGVEKRMMVDTGASLTLIASQTVRDLKLDTHDGGSISLIGFGGTRYNDKVTLAEFALGRLKGKNFSLFVRDGNFDSAGLLGADFLRTFDVDLDFAKAQLSLVAPVECPNKVYWSSGNFGRVPFKIDGNQITVKMTLDERDVTAIIDTGAADTVMSLERAARSFDLDRDQLNKSRHYPFKSLSFGEVKISNPAIKLVPDQESRLLGHHFDDQHMILGMGVLRRLHLYIDYQHRMLYVTPATQY